LPYYNQFSDVEALAYLVDTMNGQVAGKCELLVLDEPWLKLFECLLIEYLLQICITLFSCQRLVSLFGGVVYDF
jgi:hypothetical protein